MCNIFTTNSYNSLGVPRTALVHAPGNHPPFFYRSGRVRKLSSISSIAEMILPGYESFAILFKDLLTTSPPPFIYIHDVSTPHITSSVVSSVLAALPDNPPFLHAIVNASTCFTARLLYDTVIQRLANWTPTWESGCQLWGDQRWNDNFDGFIHGLRAISVERSKSPTAKTRGQTTQSTPKMAIIIERAERLKEYLPDLLVPLSRLAESVSWGWAYCRMAVVAHLASRHGWT